MFCTIHQHDFWNGTGHIISPFRRSLMQHLSLSILWDFVQISLNGMHHHSIWHLIFGINTTRVIFILKITSFVFTPQYQSWPEWLHILVPRLIVLSGLIFMWVSGSSTVIISYSETVPLYENYTNRHVSTVQPNVTKNACYTWIYAVTNCDCERAVIFR